jgi:hypothetical protein
LGRTQPGDYYAAYNQTFISKDYNEPELIRIDILDVDFLLRRGGFTRGIRDLMERLPTKPGSALLECTRTQLKELEVRTLLFHLRSALSLTFLLLLLFQALR